MTTDFSRKIDKPILQNTPPLGTLLHHHFTDVDELAAYVREGDVTITPLSLTPFHCDSMALRFETIRISFNRPNVSLRVSGSKESAFLQFVCLLEGPEQPVISHGQTISHDYLFGFDPGRGVNLIFPKDSIHCCVAIRKDVFETCAQALERPDLDTKFLGSNFVYAPTLLPPLRLYLKQMYELMIIKSPLFMQPQFQHLILQDFLPLLMMAIPLQHDRLKLSKSELRRSQLIYKAEDYLQNHLEQPLTLADLCQALNVSRRTLFYGFDQVFGMSPMAYLKTLRLHAVRRALKAADPATATVVGVAYEFGFWSLGHFARDYKVLFGEKPSDTLAAHQGKRESRDRTRLSSGMLPSQ